MLNMYFSAIDCTKGFPQVTEMKLIPFRKLGTLESAVNECVDKFEAFADKTNESSMFRSYMEEFVALASSITSPEQVLSRPVSVRIEGKLIHGLLCVSVRSGDDLPTRRY